MGNHRSGRKQQAECQAGHDLTDPANVQIINRSGGKIERACRVCQRVRSREWWRKNRAGRKTAEPGT